MTAELKKSLRPFRPTRCTMRRVSLQAMTSDHSAILHWLQEVKEKEKNTAGVKAGGYLRSLTKFGTIFSLEFLTIVFTIIEGGSASLQSTQLNSAKQKKQFRLFVNALHMQEQTPGFQFYGKQL